MVQLNVTSGTKLNCVYEFSDCCCHADRSVSHLLFTKNEYRTTVPILTEIVEDIVEVSDTSSSSGERKALFEVFANF